MTKGPAWGPFASQLRRGSRSPALVLVVVDLARDALPERVAHVLVGAVERLERLAGVLRQQVLEVLVGQRLLCLALLRGVLERILALVRLFLGGGGHALAESIPAVLVRSVLVTERGL